MKGAKLCFRYPYFYFIHGERTSTASQKSEDLNKVSLLLQDLDTTPFRDARIWLSDKGLLIKGYLTIKF